MGNYGGGDRETKKANTAKMMYWKREREKTIETSDRCWERTGIGAGEF